MTTRRCRECNYELPPRVKWCPSCGTVDPKRRAMRAMVGTGLLVVAIYVFMEVVRRTA